MTPPRRAILLAAGFGSRLQPLTFRLPKPLIPLWGRPLILQGLDWLRRAGVREVLINLHHEPGALLNALRTLPHPPGLHLQFSFEPDILGTGGAIRKAAWFLSEQPLWILNADVALDLDPRILLAPFARHRADAALWMHPTRGPRTVELDGQTIRSFRSSHPGTPGTATFCGLQLFHPALLPFIKPDGPDTLVAVYERAMAAGRSVLGIASDRGFWADLGTPASLLQAHTDTRTAARQRRPGRALYRPDTDPDPTARDFISRPARAVIHPKAQLVNTLVLDQARLGPSTRLDHCVVGPEVRFNRSARDALLVRAADWPHPPLQAILAAMKWPLPETTLIPLGARGSAREFIRAVHGRDSAILVAYDSARHENTLYVDHARRLRHAGIPVPRVRADLPAQHISAFEDLGEQSLLSRFAPASARERRALYRRVLPVVVRLHTRGTQAFARARVELMPPFDRKLYAWEHDYFIDHFLVGHLGLKPADLAPLRRDLAAIARRLLRHPRVLIHRDLQSSNIFFRGGEAVLIDFQGMRWGSAAYDLASWLADPYTQLDTEFQRELLAEYRKLRPGVVLSEEDYGSAVVQRLAQALGAYAKLGAQPATADFIRHIPAALLQMRRAVERLPGLPALRRGLDEWITLPLARKPSQ